MGVNTAGETRNPVNSGFFASYKQVECRGYSVLESGIAACHVKPYRRTHFSLPTIWSMVSSNSLTACGIPACSPT
jgi:hypothetical protein